MPNTAILRFLFRLSADTTRQERPRLLRRLVTGLANLYGASAVNLYGRARSQPLAAAAQGLDLARMPREQQDQLAAIEARLVEAVRAEHRMRSALDLDEDGDVVGFLGDALGVTDVFAFPLFTEGEVRGAVVLYLPADADALGEMDMQALMAVGELLALLEEQGQG